MIERSNLSDSVQSVRSCSCVFSVLQRLKCKFNFQEIVHQMKNVNTERFISFSVQFHGDIRSKSLKALMHLAVVVYTRLRNKLHQVPS